MLKNKFNSIFISGALSGGFGVMMGILITGGVSGGHINPCGRESISSGSHVCGFHIKT